MPHTKLDGIQSGRSEDTDESVNLRDNVCSARDNVRYFKVRHVSALANLSQVHKRCLWNRLYESA